MTLLAVIDIFQTNRVDKGLYLGGRGKKINIIFLKGANLNL